MIKRVLQTFIKWFLSFCLNIFYRHISVRGEENIPTSGPVIFAGNHYNGLVDPLVVFCTVSERFIRGVAAGYLFKMPIVGSVLRLLETIPVVRRQDNQGKTANNDSAIHAMAQILVDNNCFAIFPEGVSHNSTELLELKYGFAKACMIALEKDDTLQINVVPVGLNYEAKNRFQSDIFVEFGKPLVITKQHLQLRNADEQKTLADLATNLKDKLEQVILHAPSKDLLTAAHLARMMCRDQEAQVTQQEYIGFTKVILDLLQENSKDSQDLLQSLLVFQTHLDILGLRYQDLKNKSSLVTNLIITIMSLPVSLPGALYHAPIGLLARYIGTKISKNYEDQQAHYKVMVAMILIPISYLVTFGFLSFIYGPIKSFGILILLVVSVYVAIIVRPLTFSLKLPGIILRLLTYNKEALQRENNALCEKLTTKLSERSDAQQYRSFIRSQPFADKKQE